jgi:hypothetical protein
VALEGARQAEAIPLPPNLRTGADMFQLIGSLLAFFAIFSAFAGEPLAGTVFALATFLWVLLAKPRRRERVVQETAPWGAIYAAPYSR